jgi:catechol 2,3-dioxygenase-like lactoylglutathione lyase family enzyme
MHIGHVATRVADVEASARQVVDALGLTTTIESDEVSYLTANAKHHELQLTRADQPGLDHIGLEVADGDELDACLERAVAAGGKVISNDPAEPGLARASRILGPAGLVLEVYTPMESAPLALDNVIGRHARKFGHVSLASSEAEPLVAFLVDGLGFHVSDTAGPLTWLRCDIDHHGIAVFGGAPANLMHHYAFELNGWDGMRMYLDDLAVRGEQIAWGPGRHGPGFNLFTYLPDLDGALIEGYAGMLKIEDDENYVPIDWDGHPNPMNLWGPPMPEEVASFGVPILAPTK